MSFTYIYKEWPEYPTATNLYVAPHVLKINCTSAIRTIVLHLKYFESPSHISNIIRIDIDPILQCFCIRKEHRKIYLAPALDSCAARSTEGLVLTPLPEAVSFGLRHPYDLGSSGSYIQSDMTSSHSDSDPRSQITSHHITLSFIADTIVIGWIKRDNV